MFKSFCIIIDRIRHRFESPEKYCRRVGVKIGKGCFISSKDFTSEPYLVELGDYVRIAQDVHFYSHGGVFPLRKLYNDPTLDQFGKIKIGSYTSIGARCMIMPGVTIGERCIVGGGSVVTRSVPDGCMVAGNPAKFIGYTEDFYKKIKEKNLDTKTAGLSYEEKKKVLLSLPESAFISKPFIKTERL